MLTRILPLLVMIIAGCSLTGGKSPRPVPLPPNTDPDDVVSINPDPVPELTAQQRTYLAAMDPDEPKVDDKSRLRPAAVTPPRVGAPPLALKRLQYQNDQRKKEEPKPDAGAKQKFVDEKTKDGNSLQQRLKRELPPSEYAYVEAKAWETYQKELDRKIAVQLQPGSNKNILCLCGGVAHGAYQAGAMCGWTCCGGRPDFDVITGVSTGVFVGAMVFAGSEYDADLRHFYTSIHTRDVFRVKKVPLAGIGTDSIATNKPLRELVESLVYRPGFMEKIAAEHARGRRLYFGSTNLDTMRFTTWDMGAIASQGTCEAKKLFVDIMMGASAMPPLMTPSRICVNIDGRNYEELHVDGGTTRNLFFYPPPDWPGREKDPHGRLLAGANVYCVVGGKVYGDPIGVKATLLPEGLRAISTLLASSQRAELFRLHSYCQTFDMKFNWSAIPPDYPIFNAADFDPEKMTKLFNEGHARACNGTLWNQLKADEELGEVVARRGVCLSTDETGERGSIGPVHDRPANSAVSPLPPPRGPLFRGLRQ